MLTSNQESSQQRLLWLAEQIMNWSGVPVVHVRPTVLLDNPLFTVLARRSVRERGVLALPFGTGRTSPIAADDGWPGKELNQTFTKPIREVGLDSRGARPESCSAEGSDAVR
jgi:hypothetical protein